MKRKKRERKEPTTTVHVRIPVTILANISQLAKQDRRTVHNWLLAQIEKASKLGHVGA